MKKLLLSVFTAGLGFLSFSQTVVMGVSPSSIAVSFDYTLGETSFGANNFTTEAVIAEAIFAEDGTTGTDVNGHPLSHRGCTAFTNAAAMNGKIALISRGECDFGLKALNAQNAGARAVVVINNATGMINMQGGNSGPQVTIPAVSISLADGNILREALAQGPITLLIGQKLGAFANDVSVAKADVLTPRYMTHNFLLSSSPNAPVGMVVRNSGSSTATGVTAKISLVNEANVAVYEEELGPYDINTGDSVKLLPGSTDVFPTLSAATPVGDYTLKFEAIFANDDLAADNSVSYKFTSSNTGWSIVNLSGEDNIGDLTSGIRPATQVLTEQLFCNQFRDANASNIQVTGFHSSVSVNTGDLEGKSITGYLYSWNDVFTNLDDAGIALTNLVQVGFGEYFFEDAVQSADFHLAFEEPAVLVNNQRYLVCIGSVDTNVFYAYSTERDVARNRALEKEVYSIQQTSQWYLLGFGTDYNLVTYLTVADKENSTSSTTMMEGKAFPNPANDFVRVQVAKDGNAVVTVTDLSGRTVSTQDVSFASNQTVVDLTSANSGMYIINVVYNDGARAKFNVVKN